MVQGTDTSVFVTQAAGTELTVYHSTVDCPAIPGAYTVLDRSLAEEWGLRECQRCRERRYAVLEL